MSMFLRFPLFVGVIALGHGFRTANAKYMLTGLGFVLLGIVFELYLLVNA